MNAATLAPPAEPLATEVQVPGDWLQVDFLSDVHLDPSDQATWQAWQRYMESTVCDAMFILGDLFEVWVGDDAPSDPEHGPFWHHCIDTLRHTAERLPVHFMVGNRDFLAGPALNAAAMLRGLDDPAVLDWGQSRWLMSHGDALCTDDRPYQAFRHTVRQPAWQAEFLAQPLAQRLQTARQLRMASEARKAEHHEWVDVNNHAVQQAMHTHSCTTLVHGHTHRAAHHAVPGGGERWVLSDWAALSQPPRLEVLRATRRHASEVPVLSRVNLALF